MLKHSILAFALLAQIVIGPGGGASSGGSSTTIINNNFTNITNTTGTFTSVGCQVAWNENYEYTVSACNYYINNSNYQSTEQDVTLDAAHATLDRLDIIGLDITGTVFKLTGTAAADPSEPTVDPETQIKLALILVTANTTEPAGIDSELIYFQNAGSPTEWDWTTNGSCFVTNSAVDPKAPATLSINGTSCAANAYAQGQIGSGSIDPNSFLLLKLYIKSKATWSNNRGLNLAFYSAGVLVGQPVQIFPTNTWGFTSSITSAYQQVAIPISNFLVPNGTTATQFRITKFGSGANIGMFIADITVQGNAIVAPPSIIPGDCPTGQVLVNINDEISCSNGLNSDTTTGLAITNRYRGVPVSHGTVGATETIDLNTGVTHYLTLDENLTLTFSNPLDGDRFILMLRQDGSGTNTVTFPATVEWPDSDTIPELDTTANALNLCTFLYVSAVTNYYGACNVSYVE